MKINSPYLEAIQSIAGTTRGEKQKTIHEIAKQLARVERGGNYLSDLKTPVPNVPEPLRPLVRVEVAKILRQHEGIIEALKSHDPVVVARAVQAEWFFDGSNTGFVNPQYFRENVFPNISMFARFRAIKGLANHLKDTAVAADFFITVAELYGVNQALPLLLACDEDFVYNAIIERKITLSLKQVELLYRKYPNLVIKYLKYGNPEGDNVRNAYSVNVRNYVTFFRELSVKHFEEFMEIYELEYDNNLDFKLCSTAVRTFLKTKQNLLIENPDRYLKLIPLEKVTRKLSRENFLKMFKNFNSLKIDRFNYDEVESILKYYKPAEDKLALILKTFHEVNGKDLLDVKDLIDYQLIQLLPAADRVKIARLKLEKEGDWQLYDPNRSWRCYLPTSESIPMIKKEIGKTSDNTKRQLLLKLLVHTCKINNDKEALLNILNYFYDRHRNERTNVFINYMQIISEEFDLEMLSSAHWLVLNKYIKIVEMQDNSYERTCIMLHFTEAAIHYCLLNDLSFDDYLRLFLESKIKRSYGNSKFFSKYPKFEKKLIELVIETIPRQYPLDNANFWKDEDITIVDFVTSSLWSYNKRNRYRNCNQKLLSIKDYPWLFEKVKHIIFGDCEKTDCYKKSLLNSIKENERDFYDQWLLELPKFWEYGNDVIYEILRKQPQLVFDNWTECIGGEDLSFLRDRIFYRFVKKIRWYQNLPINIFDKMLDMYNYSSKTASSMFFLASLMDGETFAKILEPFIPENDTMDVEDPEARENYKILRAITKVMPKVNPPVSLDTIAKFCLGDYLQIMIGSMSAVSCQFPVSEVMLFTRTLMSRRVSVKKHGIRLIRSVAPLEEVSTVLTDLWKTEGHPSIRMEIFKKIYALFCEQATSRNWNSFRTCLDSLKEDDDDTIFTSLPCLSKIPNEYLYDYIKTALGTLKSVEEKSQHPKPIIEFSCDLVRNIDNLITNILPEEYSQELIKKFLFVFDYDEQIFNAGLNLTLDGYLLNAGDNYESRYKFFETFFRDSVQKYWDKPHPESVHRYPINVMVNSFFNSFISKTARRKHDEQIAETFLKIFNSVLQPYQDPSSYLGLVYSTCFHKSNDSTMFCAMMIKKVPELIRNLSPEFIISISDELLNFLRPRNVDELKTRDEGIFDAIKIFTNSENIHCAFIAANMLLKNNSKYDDEQYQTVIDSLRDYHHPGISALVNKLLINYPN